MPSRQGQWRWLGRVPFAATARLQECVRAEVQGGRTPETLLLCEHDPVVTLGRGARPENVLLSAADLQARGVAVERATRGGDVTYHGPGQIVGYPIFRLRQGVVDHVERMAAAIVAVLAGFSIPARWRRDCPGVWVDDRKICAFGIHVSRRVAMHGFALNVTTPREAFDVIVPCGLKGCGVTSIDRENQSEKVADLASIARLLVPAIEESFDILLAHR